MTSLGWPAPIVIDSGNGFHLLYRIHLPNDDGSKALSKYSLVGGNWTLNGTVGADADDYRGLTGYVAGNDLTVSMPITTHVVHKNPDAAKGIYINYYLWLFSPDNIKSSTVKYTLTRPNPADLSVDRNQMNGEWQNVGEDHKYVLTPMYQGTAETTAQLAPISYQPGLNQSASFYLNEGLALPAYECFPVIVAICYTRTFTNHSSTPVDSLKFDIFPPTLDGFMALTSAGAWIPAVASHLHLGEKYYDYPRVVVNAYVHPDGSMTVVERRTFESL